MVFRTAWLLYKKNPKIKGPDEFWKKRKVFRLSAHFWGRSRNCYTLALRRLHRAMQFTSKGRHVKRQDLKELCNVRLAAACEEHSFNSEMLREGLMRNNIHLDRKTLVDLAIWEPRTFKSLTDLAWSRVKEDGVGKAADLADPPPGVITRGMLK